jgi:hypothetical protein
LEKGIRETGSLPLEPFELTTSTEEIQSFFALSPFLQSLQLHSAASCIQCRGDCLEFRGLPFDAYYASVLADFLRRKALHASLSFSFETVMSARDKVDLLQDAQARGSALTSITLPLKTRISTFSV